MGRAREGYFLYKYVYRDEIIYIGRTTNIVTRIQTHAKGQGPDEKFLPYLDEADVYIHECSTETVMKSLESLLIEAHKPILNIQGKTSNQLMCTISDISWTLYNEQDYVETVVSPKPKNQEEKGPFKKQSLKRTREQLDQILKIVDLCPELLSTEISNDLDDVYNKIKQAAKQQTVIAVTSSNILNLALNNNDDFFILGDEKNRSNQLWSNVVNTILDEKSIQQKVEAQNATEEQIVQYLKMPKAKDGDIIRKADQDGKQLLDANKKPMFRRTKGWKDMSQQERYLYFKEGDKDGNWNKQGKYADSVCFDMIKSECFGDFTQQINPKLFVSYEGVMKRMVGWTALKDIKTEKGKYRQKRLPAPYNVRSGKDVYVVDVYSI